MTRTVVVQIGNTDNKLTQNEWAHFCFAMRDEISKNVHRIHFQGGSSWDDPWQNACWVCEVLESQLPLLEYAVKSCRHSWRQESAAVTIGETKFI